MELFDIVVGISIGCIIGSTIIYLITSRLTSKKQLLDKDNRPVIKDLSSSKEKIIQKNVLEKARKELNSILLEKELLANALTRVYEAEVQNKITKEEREELTRKYSSQMKVVEEKLGNTELLIEVGDLENLRNELINLFEQKIDLIEKRLDQSKIKLNQIIGNLQIAKEASKEEKQKETPKEKPKSTEVDDKVNALREEVLQALDRLEQLDFEE